ncbi:putative protein OS=Tsukamurella paurometabola (strain ATCC 8368 / DSM / CCUG 35730 /CIP 100753 / JCM 10117 / KCTC 9821 / NBRC 16120 / NCIMB 702349/ NCTC 13040) OX=521096 GN=Tpau_3217 PE=4 SV=1 [Tsukamurella paurometabola]|uniref:Uncharacterized protein n=1 Tax=Tsukamurella paurometabola (strain ATCC 8368 / DSM 20162 / CCUG 35730 / CIP 100753 / JCM 10117 / KCTC 9821 / NBRC 16120 / NCIMB 702349 / NCTC 13040) TaxID=521096 RepID=D5UVM2_TSUPD|nr:hypothetical protein [Tsukamurella paurometabola]ADG79804.1 hypothetical protein Tpau_3217 [Tsukamurella paurometabola DSM 20162]SUP37286.1 Uncharacterised protein [Tsukamurella paurometabola]
MSNAHDHTERTNHHGCQQLPTVEAAEKVGAPDAKTFRKFLRSVGYDKRAEEGRARYAFDSKDVTALKRQYAAYEQEAKRTKADDATPED